MSAIRLRLFVAIVFLALTSVVAATAAAATTAPPRPGARAFAGVEARTAASPGAMVPTYAFRVRMPQMVVGRPNSTLADPARGRLYISATDNFPTLNTLTVIDTRQAKRLATLEGIGQLYHLTLTQDGKRVVGANYDPASDSESLVVIDAQTLAIVDEFPLPCTPEMTSCGVMSMAAGPDGRLYWIAYNDKRVNVLDLATHATIDRFVAGDDSGLAEVMIAGDKLFVTEPAYNNNEEDIWRYDISTPTAVLKLSKPLEFGADSWQVAPDGSYLIGNSSWGVHQHSAETLLPIRTLYEPVCCGGPIIAISPDSKRVFQMFETVSYAIHPFKVYDAESGALINTGAVDASQIGQPNPKLAIGLENGGLAVVIAGYVDLYAATHYTTALPLAFSNHCPGGPFRDDFSNPNSGWPSRTGETVISGYIDNRYQIWQRDANRWFGVTRGDPWRDSKRVEIETRAVNADGFSGLIFGLNDDWSRFNTFEVYPSLGRWAVFEFNETNGWVLLRTDLSPAVRPTGQWNKLTIHNMWGMPEMQFEVNDSLVVNLRIRDGRVGLSAGSIDPNFEARYDNYVFTGKNCDVGNRAASMESAPYLERPPLEDFLK